MISMSNPESIVGDLKDVIIIFILFFIYIVILSVEMVIIRGKQALSHAGQSITKRSRPFQ